MKTTFIAPDSSVAVDVEHSALWAMLDLCASAGRLETGGILARPLLDLWRPRSGVQNSRASARLEAPQLRVCPRSFWARR